MSSSLQNPFSAVLPTTDAPERPIKIFVTEKGFEPAAVDVKVGESVILMILRRTDRTCAREIVIDEAGIHQSLPVGIPVRIVLTPASPGQIIFGCAMKKMVRGVLNVVPAA